MALTRRPFYNGWTSGQEQQGKTIFTLLFSLGGLFSQRILT